MTRKKPALFTIGYEHAKPDAVFRELKKAKVELLVDVRAVTSSRRPGFSKNQFAAGLDEHGIGYLHLRGLGTPKEGRVASHSGDLKALWRIYEKHLKTPEAKEDFAALTGLVESGRRVCLLCYERDVNHCHRLRIAELVHDGTGAKIQNLVPALF
jgi:uncharacterized protein (DUF488 family)